MIVMQCWISIVTDTDVSSVKSSRVASSRRQNSVN